MNTLKQHLNKAVRGGNLTRIEAKEALLHILADDASPVQTGAFLASLATRGEALDEVIAIAESLRAEMLAVPGLEGALDIVGTGGDGYDTINVSTLAAFVCASLGVPIAKHGTKALSSKCGSFDLLEMLNVSIPKNPEEAEIHFSKNKIVFLFAPYYHPTLKKLHSIRKDLGIRTIFNFVGPLLNPGNTRYQVIGVSSKNMADKVGETLMHLGRERVLVIHSQDGLDEASVSTKTDVYDYAPGREMVHFVVEPENYYPIESISGGSPEENTHRFLEIISGRGTQAENEFVALNAALGLYAVGAAYDIKTGREKALKELLSGRVLKVLEKVINK